MVSRTPTRTRRSASRLGSSLTLRDDGHASVLHDLVDGALLRDPPTGLSERNTTVRGYGEKKGARKGKEKGSAGKKGKEPGESEA